MTFLKSYRNRLSVSHRRIKTKLSKLKKRSDRSDETDHYPNAVNKEGEQMINNIALVIKQSMSFNKSSVTNLFETTSLVDMPLDEYLYRLVKYVNAWTGETGGKETSGAKCLVMAIMYLECHGLYSLITRQNLHSVMMAAMLGAIKFIEDLNITSIFWAQVAGMTVQEVNLLERQFLTLVNYELFIDPDVFEEYVKLLLVDRPVL